LLASGFGLFALRPYIKIQLPQLTDIKEAAKFGLGLIPHSVLSQVIRLSDRLFIVYFIGLPAAGEYAVGAQIASIMLVLLSSFNQAWTPYLFSKLANADEDTKKQLVNTSYKIAVAFVVVFSIINLAVSQVFVYMVSPKFHGAERFVSVTTVAYFFTGCYMLFTDYIFFTKKNPSLFYNYFYKLFYQPGIKLCFN